MAPKPATWLTSSLLAMTSLCVVITTCHGYRLTSEKRLPTPPDASRSKRQSTQDGQQQPSPPSSQQHPQEVRYGVLLDAGSSSTKVKVYSYTPASTPSGVPHVRLAKSERVKPGLSSFVSRPQGELRGYLQKVVNYSVHEVPEYLHASSPVYVMATAGMRVMEVGDAKRLLGEVGSILQDSSLNPFLFHERQVHILAGEEEAVFAWLAVNYLRGFFREEDSSPSPQQSVGVLEMGGGSMQVAFLPDSPLYQEEFQMYVGRRRFDLYAQTYLSYGSNYLTGQVRWRLLQKLRQLKEEEEVSGPLQSKSFHSPCMLAGDTDEFRWEGDTYTVRGTGNTSECEQVLSSLLSPVDQALCSPGPCTIGDTYQPPVGRKAFYAISAFLYAPRNLRAVGPDGVLNITRLRLNANDYCSLSVPQAVNQTGTPAQFASNDCLMGLYIPLLLTSALGFEPSSTAITVAKRIDGEKIDWALGAMVQKLSTTFITEPDHLDPCHSVKVNHLPTGELQERPSSSSSSRSCPLTSTFFFVLTLALLVGCVVSHAVVLTL